MQKRSHRSNRLRRLSIVTVLTTAMGSWIAQTHALTIDVQKRVLDNGVTVLVWERPSAGRIGARSFYKVDIAAERPGTVGLTHMLEHHLFKGSDIAGTASWEQEREIAERVERLARQIIDVENSHPQCLLQRSVFAETEADCTLPELTALRTQLNEATAAQNALADTTWYDQAVQGAGGTNSTASTGRDWMKFDIDLPANKLELFLWTERARLEHPVFRHFEPEKEVVVDQIRRYDNSPDGKFGRVMRSLSYDAHPYGWAHWFSDLTRATREDHWEIFYKYFIPQNLVLVVVGDVDAETVFSMTETYFGSWQPGRPSPRLRTVEPEPIGQKRLRVSTTAGPAVAMHVPMPAVAHADTPAFEVLAELLGGPRGLMADALVDQRSIATDASATSWTAKYPSHFEIRVNARSNEQLDAVEAGINEVLAGIRRGDMAESLIQAAADRLILKLARGLDEIGNSAVTIGAMESIYGWEHLNALPGLWRSVTPEQLAAVAERYFIEAMQTVGHLERSENSATAALLPSVDSVRPGSWPVGGPIGEFFLSPQPKAAPATLAREMPAAQPAAAPAEQAQARSAGANVNQDNSAAPTTDPLAIAEQPWYTPPWMAERRGAGFAQPAPTRDYRELRYAPVDFTPPDAASHRLTLSNGLPVYGLADPLLPRVQMTVYINASSANDPQGKEGLAALTAELLRAGTKSKDQGAIEAALNAMGASLNVQSDRNGTTLTAIAPPGQLTALIDLLGELVSAPDFARALDAERERLALRAERAGDNANLLLQRLFDTSLYGTEHPFGRSASGTSVRSISESDVRDFHREYYTAQRISIAVSGDFAADTLPELFNAQQGFAALAAGKGGQPVTPAQPQAPQGIRVVTSQRDTRQGLVALGHLGIQGIPEDHAALEVMHQILAGGGFTSRMMKLLRTETGITSALFGSVEPGRDHINPYQWRFGGNQETLAEGIVLALAEIRRLRDEGMTEAEFEEARTAYLDGLIPASYDTAHKTVERFAHKETFGVYAYQAPQYLNYYAGDAEQILALRQLTRADVERVAQRYLDPDNLIIAIVGPLEAIKASASAEARRLLGW